MNTMVENHIPSRYCTMTEGTGNSPWQDILHIIVHDPNNRLSMSLSPVPSFKSACFSCKSRLPSFKIDIKEHCMIPKLVCSQLLEH